MSSITTYRCDVCHKNVEHDELQRIEINRFPTGLGYHPYYNFDVCGECMGNVLYCFGLKWNPPAPKKKGKKK